MNPMIRNAVLASLFAVASVARAAAAPATAGLANCAPVEQLTTRQTALRDQGNGPLAQKSPTDAALHDELLKMKQADQEVRAALAQSAQATNGHPDNQVMVQVFLTDSENLNRLKEIVEAGGFPDTAKVGRDGVAAAWLIVQHADKDHDFQARMLERMKPLADRGELAPQDYAMLEDRVRIAQGHPQRYGSQFRALEGVNHPQPIEDLGGVDARRAKLGLLPLRDYGCILQQVYGIPVDLKPHGLIVGNTQ